MTRDGYSILTIGFTGKKALGWKIKLIAAFNWIDAQQRQSAQFHLNDPTQLVPLLTNYAQCPQIAQSKVMALTPKAEVFDQVEASEGSQVSRVAAKVFSAPEKKFFRWLHANSWAFKQSKMWQGYSEKIKIGYLEYEPYIYRVCETDEQLPGSVEDHSEGHGPTGANLR